MELINEEQKFPFFLACLLTFIVVAFAFFFTHLVEPNRLSQNLFYWYMARAAGFTAYLLLALAVLFGASSSSGIWDRWKIRKLITQMHQYAALLVFPFLFFHLWGLHQDTTIPYHWMNLLIPFQQTYRPIQTGFGVLTLYGWILLIGTSYIREKISVKVWRYIHYASFPMFILVTLHGLFTGTDSNRVWAMLIYIIPSVLFVLLVLQRRRKKSPSSLA